MTSWIGTRVRKDEKYGKVEGDANWTLRILTVKMDDGTTEKIVMSNVGDDPNPEELHKWEWFWEKGNPEIHEHKWYRF